MNSAASTDNLQTESKTQLELLGYKDGNEVYYRALKEGASGKSVSATFPQCCASLERFSSNGYNIYLVVNGGGQSDEEVAEGKAIFYEHDDIPKEDQLYLWQSLKLPEPTFQVDTGGKSIHSYWVFEQPIDIAGWRVVQTDLLNYSKADRTIKNPSRLMRLAGYKHQSTGEVSNIVAQSGTRYTFEALRSVIPVEEPKVKPEKKAKPKAERVTKPRTEPSNSTDAIPLSNCLAKSNREILGGVVTPGRNQAGMILARDLIGVENYLDSLGQPYSESARDLFDRFVSGCVPVIGQGKGDNPDEKNIIWDSAEKFNPEPGCRREYVDKILTAWNRKAEVIDGLKQQIGDSLKLKNTNAPNLFCGKTGELLSIAAKNFNIPVQILNFCLLPILGGRIDSRTKLMISPGTNFTVPPIRWCGLVGDTGSKKSPIINLLTSAISKEQGELYEDYKKRKQDYDLEFSEWKNTKQKERGKQPDLPVAMLDLYFSNYTIESLVDSIQYHPNCGSLVMLDELAQFFSSMDMYRGGKGADRQEWLRLWNGYGIKNNRKSGVICTPQSSISILGGIQPETISNIINGDANSLDGLQSRFSYVPLPQFKTNAFTETPEDLGTELDNIYRTLSEQQPQTHCLSIESKPLWEAWHDEIEEKVINGSSGLVKGCYSKFHGIAGINALIIHRTLSAINKTGLDQLISAETLNLAIEWTKWELSQTLLQYQLLGLTEDPEVARIIKFVDKFTGRGWVSSRDVTHWWAGREKPNTTAIKSFMAKIVKLGRASDNEEQIDSTKYRIQILGNGSNSSNKNAETFTQTQESLLLTVVTEFPGKDPELAQSLVTNFVTTDNNKVSNKIEIASDNEEQIDDGLKTVEDDSNKPEMSPNGHHSDPPDLFVTNGSNSPKALHTGSSSDSVTTVTTIPSKNIFKKGGFARKGKHIVLITEVGDGNIVGIDKDGTIISGAISSFTIASAGEFEATQGDLADEWN
jgi:Protein of unknown function (DUF3987)